MRCSNCGTDNAEGTAFCMNCGTHLSSFEPPQPGTPPVPKARRLPNPRLLLFVLGAIAVLAIAVVIVRLLTARQADSAIAITPTLIIAQSERGGLVLQALDLSGAAQPLQLAPLPSLDLSPIVSFRSGAGASAGSAYVRPDGSYGLLGVKETGQWTLLRFDLRNGEPLEFLRDAQSITVLTNDSSPRFVAQATNRRGESIHVGDLDAGSLTTLIEGADEASVAADASWQHVAYASSSGGNSAYYVAGMDGRQSRAVVASATAAPYTDDGKYVYYSADDTLYRRSMDGSLPERLMAGRGGTIAIWGLSPQRDRLLVITTAGGTTDLQLLRNDGSERVSLVRDAKRLKGAAFSADGGHLLVWTNETDGDSLLLFDGRGQNQRAIFRGAQSTLARWLSDNRLQYAIQERSGLTVLYVETADGKSSERLAPSDGFQRLDQVASSDQAGFLAYAGVKDDKGLLYMAKLGGGQPQLIDETKGRFASVWLAPGGRVVYQADDGSRSSIYVADSDGKNRRLLADDATIVAANLYR